jgi:hypothetical protein
MAVRRPASIVFCLLVLVACREEHAAPRAGAGMSAPATSNATNARADTKLDASAPLVDPSPALSAAFGLPRLATMGVMTSRTMLVEAVYFATAQTGAAQTGQVTRNGTITGDQQGWRYSPAPADRLVVNFGGQVHEFAGIDAEGDSSAEFAANWLAAPHRLGYRYRMPGQVEVSVQERFDGSTFEARLIGWSALLGPRYDVDLTARGAVEGTGDADGREARTRYDVIGRIQGETLEIDVKEEHLSDFASATSLRLLTSQRGWASELRCTLASTVRSGGDTYRFLDVRMETGMKEKGGRTTSDVVSASGRIERNGRPFAEVELRDGLPVAIAESNVIPLQLEKH